MNADFAVAGCKDLLAEGAAERWIFDEGVRDLNTCQVECLGRRCDNNGVVCKFFAYRAEYGVRSFKDEIAVDFIANDNHVVLETDVADAFQFFAGPNAANGIVWTAKKEKFYFVLDDSLFEIFKVNMVASIFAIDEVATFYFAVIVDDDIGKVHIDGLLDKDVIANIGERFYRHAEREHNARYFNNPFAVFDVVIMAATVKILNSFVVVVFGGCVAKNSIFSNAN